MMEESETGSSPLNFLIDNKKVSLLADEEAGATSVDRIVLVSKKSH